MRGKLKNTSFHAAQAHLHDELVTWLHRALETGAVNACKIKKRFLVGYGAQGIKGQQGSGLSHGFEHEHAGHHGAMREMAREIRLVDADVFERLDALALFNFQHTVHQQNGIAVGQLLEDLVNVHHGGAEFRFQYEALYA